MEKRCLRLLIIQYEYRKDCLCKNNHRLQISFAVSLQNLSRRMDPTMFGSMLFRRGVSGTRVVSTRATKKIAGITFQGYGAHCDAYPVPYFNAACAVGLTKEVMHCLQLLTVSSTSCRTSISLQTSCQQFTVRP